MATMVERMIGAARLDNATYEEVEHDLSATSQAAGVVAIVAVARTIGAIGDAPGLMIMAPIAALLQWAVWAGVTYLVGDKMLGGTATWGELLRTLGFAQAPGVFYVLGAIPNLGGLIEFVVGLWILVAGIIAIRQACDFGTGKAILTAVIGFVLVILPLALLGLIFGRGG